MSARINLSTGLFAYKGYFIIILSLTERYSVFANRPLEHGILLKAQLMLPLFGDDKRREINLGGSTSATSQAAILNQARARRIERETIRKRQESAVTIQAWWRGITGARRVRQQLREQFSEDVTSLTGLRCLVLIGQDEDVLDRWATEVLSRGTWSWIE